MEFTDNTELGRLLRCKLFLPSGRGERDAILLALQLKASPYWTMEGCVRRFACR